MGMWGCGGVWVCGCVGVCGWGCVCVCVLENDLKEIEETWK